MVKVHEVKAKPYPGTDFAEIYPRARRYYNQLKASTKRQPYIRSTYFDKDKVFLELFWIHLNQKNRKERNRRLKFFACGIELLRTTRSEPTVKQNPEKTNEQFYRFAGLTPSKELFYIQIKEHRRTHRKDLISIFPAN